MKRRYRDGRREDGATLVEFAVLMPLMLLMIIGITEFGIGFKDWLTVANATREGARMGAVVGNDIDADCNIIGAVMNNMGIAGVDNVQEFWVFKANSDGSPSGTRNTYTYLSGDPADCTNWSGVIAGIPRPDRPPPDRLPLTSSGYGSPSRTHGSPGSRRSSERSPGPKTRSCAWSRRRSNDTSLSRLPRPGTSGIDVSSHGAGSHGMSRRETGGRRSSG